MSQVMEEVKKEKKQSNFLVVTKTESGMEAQASETDDAHNWYEVRMVGKLPQRRSYHVGVIYKDKLIISGGTDIREGPMNSIYQLSLKGMHFDESKQVFNESDFHWNLVQDSGDKPQNIAHHKAVEHEGHMWVFGGNQNGLGNSHIYKLNLDTFVWEKLPAQEDGPEARDDHSLVWWNDGSRAVMIAFGGFVDSGRENDLWEYGFESGQWKKIEPITKEMPCKRSGHSAVIYQDKMYIFGGVDDEINRLNDLWEFDLKKKTWCELKVENPPASRNSHSATLFHHTMIIFGGMHDLTKELNDLYGFDFQTQSWRRYMKEDLISFSKVHQQEERKSPSNSPDATLKKSPLQPGSPLKSPMKQTTHSTSPRRKTGASPKKLNDIFRFDRDKDHGGEKGLGSPISIQMQNSFLIQNADQSFDQYYYQHLKKRKQQTLRGEISHEPTFGLVQYKRPPARDGHLAELYQGCLLVMGGDRHHMPYNDMYILKAKQEILSITDQLKMDG